MNTYFDYEKFCHLQKKIFAWCRDQNNIKAAAVVGSYARNNPTKESDIDIIILTDAPEFYLNNIEWLSFFGDVEEVKNASYGKVTSLHTKYNGLLELEFSFAKEDWVALPPDKDTFNVIMDGVRVIYDKENLFGKFIHYLAKQEPKVTFRLATINDKPLIKQWWTKTHVIEFWDNSPGMWQNVENYLQGKKVLFDYWLGFLGKTPFCLLMTSEIEKNLPPDDPYFRWVAKDGLTMSVDFMIGEEAFLGKGLGHHTLKEFSSFLHEKEVIRLIIDPAETNPRAKHVYQKAGFKIVDTFDRLNGYFAGVKHSLMIKNLQDLENE